MGPARVAGPKGFVWYLDAEDSQEDGRELSAAKEKEDDPDFAPPEPVARKRPIGGGSKPVEMRRIGDAEWRYFASYTDAAKAFKVSEDEVYDAVAALTKKAPEQIQIFYKDGNVHIAADK